MNGDNPPSEAVVAARIGSAGEELVRTGGDSAFANMAGKYRTEPLDKNPAAGTVAANGKAAQSMDMEKARLGELADEVDTVRVGKNGSGKSRPGSGSRAGQGTESVARSSRPSA